MKFTRESHANGEHVMEETMQVICHDCIPVNGSLGKRRLVNVDIFAARLGEGARYDRWSHMFLDASGVPVSESALRVNCYSHLILEVTIERGVIMQLFQVPSGQRFEEDQKEWRP